MSFFATQLQQMLPKWDCCDIIQQKDGITVARVHVNGQTAILKAFENPEHRREIRNYAILNSLHIPSPRILAQTDCALLMEDLQRSDSWRLGTPEDMSDAQTATNLARWYRMLHDSGAEYVHAHGATLYDESDYFTRENLQHVLQRFGMTDLPVARLLTTHFDAIAAKVRALPRTLTYNDFYYTNFAVASNASAAMMFDYNLLGKGYRYNDIGNVLASLSADAGQAFLAAYGETDPREKQWHDVISLPITLHLAGMRDSLPRWAEDALQQMQSDAYRLHVEEALK